MKRLLVVVALALSTAACGAYQFGTGVNPTPTPPRAHFDVTATEKDHAVALHVGQTLEVVLHGGTAQFWQQVKSSDPAVLQPVPDPAATAVQGVRLAAFKAGAAGNATVTAVGVPVCPSGQACPMYAMLYSLSVTVKP
ncbi:MAG TPA: hypothetical protein VNA65_09400 [Candidatus Dormibacteraeota bacterium]|nr:hypothetical protein [Candidatus Dormibacteraeota bacterium]